MPPRSLIIVIIVFGFFFISPFLSCFFFLFSFQQAINPWGEVIATCDENEHVVICDLDMIKVEEMRQGIPTSMQKRTDLYELKDLEVISQK